MIQDNELEEWERALERFRKWLWGRGRIAGHVRKFLWTTILWNITRFAHKARSFLYMPYCPTCLGSGLEPKSGYHTQPDGYLLCTDCRGHKWLHMSKSGGFDPEGGDAQ